MNDLIELNGFSQGIDGVYQAGSAEREFNYSDGEESEAQLYKVLSTVTDLSSTSAELQEAISDWPTEYHLSSTRANLLRPLNLDGVVRVLELGCGCGAITRYLGEQTNLQIDAVEGSSTRAGLAALRCRDLPNVTVSTANFNEIKFPENYYDLVLFVGVTEYAGRFSERESDEEALRDLLALGKNAVTHEGCVVIAIENRLGLKYLLGASEDHYGVPFVGIDHYPASTGIRTYSREEWLGHTHAFNHTQFLYPFPDYKVPTMVVNESAIHELSEGAKGIQSRDYLSAFELGDHEHYIWQGLAQSGSLAQHANSFLIVLSDRPESIDTLCDFSIASYRAEPLKYLDVVNPRATPSPVLEVKIPGKVQRHLNAEIVQLQSHAGNLQAKVDLMSGSIGWRFLNGIRRLFGKTTI